MLIIGADYHPSFQQISFCNQDTGAMGRRLAIRLYWMWRNQCEYSPKMEFGSYVGQLGTGHGAK